MASPSGTGHDTAGRRDSDLLAAPLSTRDGEPIFPAPVAVPGPASADEPCTRCGATPETGLTDDCPECQGIVDPLAPGPASVSPAEPPATVTPALDYCEHGYSAGEHCRTCEIRGVCKACDLLERKPEMSEFYTDPETGIVYWRDEQGVLSPRVLTDTKGEVVGYKQAAGFFPGRDPVVSPADTRGYVGPVAHEITFDAQRDPMFQDEDGNGWVPLATYNERCDERDALLAVGERDRAPELGPVPTEAGGPGKEETYWLTQKLKASIRHLRDIEDYYRPRSQELGSYNEQRADRARGLYEQITADFLHGKLDVPPEIVALRESGERDRQQIARLTEALEAALDRLVHVNGNTLLTIYEAQQIIRAVLAGEEDAANG